MRATPTTKDAYRLLHDGTLVLSKVESHGMRVDVPRLERTIKRVTNRIEKLTAELQTDDVWKRWKKRFGAKASLGSRLQLGKMIFGELGHEVSSITASGKRPQVNEESLSKIDLPFVQNYLQVEKLKKLVGTYLKGVRREVVDGYLHAVFNLHLVRTFRSSSDSPNFQNLPIRDKVIGKLIRSCFIPRDGHVLVEIDYRALEVCIAACYHRDRNMIAYIKDSSKDLHRDMAAECFLLPVDQVTKEARFYTKNQFVFPEFYGSFYAQCAPHLWDAVTRAKLKTADGVPLLEHLRSKGIKRLGECDFNKSPRPGTYENHIQEVEARFWGERFAEYARWKREWWSEYEKTGWFDLKTGFRCEGVFKRNDVINYPVQGAAFHCLLWSLIELVRVMDERGMRSKIVGQIHDSLVCDVHRDELEQFLSLAKDVMTRQVRDHWPWIIVPLTIEVEVSESNWYEKQEWSLN